MKSSSWGKKGDLVTQTQSIWQPDYCRQLFYDTHNVDQVNSSTHCTKSVSAFASNETRVRDKGAPNTKKRTSNVKQSSPVKKGEIKKEINIRQMFAKRKRESPRKGNNLGRICSAFCFKFQYCYRTQ